MLTAKDEEERRLHSLQIHAAERLTEQVDRSPRAESLDKLVEVCKVNLEVQLVIFDARISSRFIAYSSSEIRPWIKQSRDTYG